MYWEDFGFKCTGDTISLAVQKALELKIDDIVVASNSGQTVINLLEHIKTKSLSSHFNIVCVTHQVGFKKPGEDEMKPEVREKLKNSGVQILTTTHLLAGVDRALRFQFGGIYPSEIVAMSLRMLGQGVKVGLEIAVMALDAGLITYGQDVIAIGGTGEGADTAIVVKPAHSAQIFESKIKEIVCKPKLW